MAYRSRKILSQTGPAFWEGTSWQSTARAASHENADDVIWQNVLADVQLWTGSGAATKRLWHEHNLVGRQWDEVREKWRANRLHFWIEWYEDALEGREPDWEILTKIALIADNIWEQGAEAVAEEIARIEEQIRLLREVTKLKSQLADARSEVAAFNTRSHNNPPELVEPIAEVERHAGAIAEALEEAETELAKDQPRPAVLNRVGQVLLSVAGKSLSYCASLGDVAIKKAAEEVGSTGAKVMIGAGLITWVSHLEAVQVLARALESFAKLWGGG